MCLLLVFGLASCVDDRYNFDNLDSTIELGTDLVGPLAYSDIDVVDILGSNSIKDLDIEIAGDTMYIVRRDSQHLGNDLIGELKVLPQGRFDLEVPIDLLDNIEETSASFSRDFEIKFNVNTDTNDRLDSILMGHSNIDVGISFPKKMIEGSYLRINFKPDELLLNPELYPENSIYIDLNNYEGSENSYFIYDTIDLYGAMLKLSGRDRISINIEGIVNTTEEINLENKFGIHLDCTHMVPHLTYMNIGNERDIVEKIKEVEFGYTNDFYFSDAFLPFYNPEIYMTCYNNIGVPARYYLDCVEGYSSTTGEVVKADFGGPNPDTTSIYIEAPSFEEIKGLSNKELLEYDVRNLTKQTNLILNREFGHTDRLFKIKVDKLKYKYRIRSVEKDRNNVHFFFQNSFMELTEVTKLPLWFEGDEENPEKNFYYHRTDTMSIETDLLALDGYEITEGTKGILKFNYINHLPIGAKAKLKFIDENGNELIESCTQEFLIKAAQVNEMGEVSVPSEPEEMLMISLNYTELKEFLSQVTDIVIDYRLENENHKNVMLHTTDWLNVKVMFHLSGSVIMNPQEK